MTRVLFWNIEQFNMQKFFGTSTTATVPFTTLTVAQGAPARRQLLYDCLEAARPDIFVVVEVNSSASKVSALPTPSDGLWGLIHLLSELRSPTGSPPDSVRSPDWRLVPPFYLAGKGNSGLETVGVFYRGVTGTGTTAVTRYFTGPNVWPGGVRARPRRPGTATPGAYGSDLKLTKGGPEADINAMLVPPTTTARTIPNNALHNPGLVENTVASRFDFLDRTITPAPTALSFGVARPPLMVTFTEVVGTTVRNLTLFAAHAPAKDVGPTAGTARGFLQNMGRMTELTEPLGTAETRVVVGDFNTNILAEDGTLTDAYDPITSLNGNPTYSLLLKPAGTPPDGMDAYKGYFTTVIANPKFRDDEAVRASKLLWSATDTDLAYYPGYGYAAPDKNLFSLDNILVWPLDDERDYGMSILNSIVGTPLTAVPDPPGTPPVGTLALDNAMGGDDWPQAPTAAVWTDRDAANAMTAWDEYAHIFLTSDHFGIFADV